MARTGARLNVAAGQPRGADAIDEQTNLIRNEKGAEKAVTSSRETSRSEQAQHKAGKSQDKESESSIGLASTEAALSLGAALPAATSVMVNTAEVNAIPAWAKLPVSYPGANWGPGQFGTVAQLPAVPMMEDGTGLAQGNGGVALNPKDEAGQALKELRIDSDAGQGNAVGNPGAVEDARAIEHSSQAALVVDAATGSGMSARNAGDAQLNPLRGPSPDSLPDSVSNSLLGPAPGPAQSAPPVGSARVNLTSATGTRSGSRSTVQGAVHGAGVQAQASGLADGAGWMRDPVLTGQTPTGGPGLSAKGSVESALREPFVALDSEAAPGAVEWIRAGARQAEAGFEDPALGWIGVRAELSGGGVHAALVPGSADAAEQLGRQMDGLHAYLAEQRTPVDSLVMAAPVRSSADSGSGGFGHGAQHQMGQGTEHGASQNTPDRASRGAESNSVPGRPEAGRASVAQAASAVHGTDMYTPSGRGAHISLMA